MDINDFRGQYPEYNEYDDESLTKALHQKHYSDVPYDKFKEAFNPGPSLGDRTGGLLGLNKGVVGSALRQTATDIGYNKAKSLLSEVGQEAKTMVSHPIDTIKQTAKDLPSSVLALPETAASVVTGSLGAVAGIGTKLGAKALGYSDEQAKSAAQTVASAMTYQPFQQKGQEQVAAISRPIDVVMTPAQTIEEKYGVTAGALTEAFTFYMMGKTGNAISAVKMKIPGIKPKEAITILKEMKNVAPETAPVAGTETPAPVKAKTASPVTLNDKFTETLKNMGAITPETFKDTAEFRAAHPEFKEVAPVPFKSFEELAAAARKAPDEMAAETVLESGKTLTPEAVTKNLDVVAGRSETGNSLLDKALEEGKASIEAPEVVSFKKRFADMSPDEAVVVLQNIPKLSTEIKDIFDKNGKAAAEDAVGNAINDLEVKFTDDPVMLEKIADVGDTLQSSFNPQLAKMLELKKAREIEQGIRSADGALTIEEPVAEIPVTPETTAPTPHKIVQGKGKDHQFYITDEATGGYVMLDKKNKFGFDTKETAQKFIDDVLSDKPLPKKTEAPNATVRFTEQGTIGVASPEIQALHEARRAERNNPAINPYAPGGIVEKLDSERATALANKDFATVRARERELDTLQNKLESGEIKLTDHISEQELVENIREMAARVANEDGSFRPGAFADAYDHLALLGRKVYDAGHTTFKSWSNVMKQHLGNLWQHVKHMVGRAFQDTKRWIANEQGMLGKPWNQPKNVKLAKDRATKWATPPGAQGYFILLDGTEIGDVRTMLVHEDFARQVLRQGAKSYDVMLDQLGAVRQRPLAGGAGFSVHPDNIEGQQIILRRIADMKNSEAFDSNYAAVDFEYLAANGRRRTEFSVSGSPIQVYGQLRNIISTRFKMLETAKRVLMNETGSTSLFSRKDPALAAAHKKYGLPAGEPGMWIGPDGRDYFKMLDDRGNSIQKRADGKTNIHMFAAQDIIDASYKSYKGKWSNKAWAAANELLSERFWVRQRGGRGWGRDDMGNNDLGWSVDPTNVVGLQNILDRVRLYKDVTENLFVDIGRHIGEETETWDIYVGTDNPRLHAFEGVIVVSKRQLESILSDRIKAIQPPMTERAARILAGQRGATTLEQLVPGAKHIEDAVAKADYTLKPKEEVMDGGNPIERPRSLKDFFDKTPVAKWAGDLEDKAHQLRNDTSQIQSDLRVALQNAPGKATDYEKLYDTLEANKPLDEAQATLNDTVIAPIVAARNRAYNDLKAAVDKGDENPEILDNMDFSDPDHLSRVVMDRGGTLDKIMAGVKTKVQGSPLSQTTGQLKARVMRVLVDDVGNRKVVAVKGNNVYGFENKLPIKLKGWEVSETGDSVISPGPKGKQWQITDGLTSEIEAATKLEYSHNILANELLALSNLRRVKLARDFMEEIKTSPEFKDMAVKVGTQNLPNGYRTTKLQQFREYAFPEHVAQMFDDLSGQLGGDPMAWYSQVNTVMRNAIFYNALMHLPNIISHAVVERGASAWLNPARYPALVRTSIRATRAVLTQNADYKAFLDSNASMLYADVLNKDIHQLMWEKMSHEVQSNKPLAIRMSKDLGLKVEDVISSIYRTSNKVTWATNDILIMRAAMEEMSRKGISMEEAITKVEKHIPNYRVPTQVLHSRTVNRMMKDPNITMFGAYHYGALRSYGEMAKDIITGTAKEKLEAIDKIIMIGVMMSVIYPALDEVAKKITGYDKAKIRRAGATTFPENVDRLVTGRKDLPAVIQSVLTPSVAATTAVRLEFGRDPRTGQRVSPMKAVTQSIAPVETGSRIATGTTTPGSFIAGLFGISTTADRTAAEDLMIQAGQDVVFESTSHSRLTSRLRNRIWDEGFKAVQPDIEEALKKGELKSKDVESLQKSSQMSSFAYHFDHMRGGPEAMFMVWDAATPDEKKLAGPIYLKRLQNAFENTESPEEQAMIRDHYKIAIQEIKAL